MQDNNIEFWRKFVTEFFAPIAKKKWCVSMYGSGRQTTGVIPKVFFWKIPSKTKLLEGYPNKVVQTLIGYLNNVDGSYLLFPNIPS